MPDSEEKKDLNQENSDPVAEAPREMNLDEKLKALEEEMAQLKAQVEDKHDKHLRAVAELSNYRKRVQREREELMRLAREDLVLKLVDVLDNFDRALAAAKTMSDFESFHKGVELILKQMSQTLEREGLVPFESKGQTFDPTKHEAVMTVETDQHPPGIVMDEISRGYTLGDRVVRQPWSRFQTRRARTRLLSKPDPVPPKPE
jgi:molecular chaperone GrpE